MRVVPVVADRSDSNSLEAVGPEGGGEAAERFGFVMAPVGLRMRLRRRAGA
jgi:hypothetical protein